VSARQQPVMVAFEHVWTVRSQTSSVQTLVSAQLPLLEQHPAIAGLVQTWVVGSHRSCVHALLSAQSALL
jgi:hypothetical protein